MTSRPIVVWVPDEDGERFLADVVGLRVVRYEREADLLAPDVHGEVLIPGFRPSDDTADLLARLPRLRLVQLRSAGAERWVHRIPAGVQLSDCRGAHSGPTAEWVLTGLLAMQREFLTLLRNQDRGHWQRIPSDTLAGKRILLVGAGDLADEVIRRLSGFDVAATTRVGRRPRPGVHGVRELPALLPHHDVVVLAVPLTPETRRLAGARFLAAMPDGAILVNASRGPVVDTDALVYELHTGRLRAVLDVVDPEPLPPGHPLWTAPGALITPHIAGIDTRPRWRERAYTVIRTQLIAVTHGRHPPNLVIDGY